MPQTWALVPVKAFAMAKTRLDPVLSRAECAALAEHMTRDVLRALTATPGLTGTAVLSSEPGLARLAETTGCHVLTQDPAQDLCTALGEAARRLEAGGARTLLIVPADLPTLSAADIQGLLDAHAAGVTLCPAVRDGGTNALLLTPPTAIPPLFGPDSAQRHASAADERQVPVVRRELAAFARDIDTPPDLEWLLTQRVASATLAWLRVQRIDERLRQRSPAIAS